jgi:hypothetical protein
MRALMIAAVLAAASAAASPARAEAPKLVAIASPGPDARKAVAIGPEGQVYEPDGKGNWIRTQAGGVADPLVAVTSASGQVLADAKGNALFKLRDGIWSSVYLDTKLKAILGTGSRALAAVGKTIYALDKGRAVKLGEAPVPVLALAGSRGGVVVSTSKGLMSMKGKTFTPIKKAPKNARTLVSDRWVLVDRGVIDLKSLKTTSWPAGAHVGDGDATTATTAKGELLIAVGTRGKAADLYTVNAKTAKLESESIPFATRVDIVGVVADKAGRVVVGTRDGQLAVREGGKWTIATVREELADGKPGPAPAESP